MMIEYVQGDHNESLRGAVTRSESLLATNFLFGTGLDRAVIIVTTDPFLKERFKSLSYSMAVDRTSVVICFTFLLSFRQL